VRKGISVVRERLPQGTVELEPVLARNPQRLNPLGRIRQQVAQNHNKRAPQGADSFSRYYTTATKGSSRQNHSPLKTAVGKLTTVSPFASTLRPKLCGALPRSAGGYTLGGSARYFSHSPAAPSEVIQQVSQAMRAFILSGKDVRYSQRHGNRRYVKGQIKAQLAAASVDPFAPGAYVDFRVAPTFTCLSPNEPVGVATLDQSRGGFLDELNVDFQETIRDISAVFQDLRRLATLGDLPISLVDQHTLRVHFHGCDAEIVTRLCDEVGVMRGVIHEDERFTFDRLLAGTDRRDVNWREMMSSSGESEWSQSVNSHDQANEILLDVMNEPAWESALEEDYDEIEPGGESSSEGYGSQPSKPVVAATKLPVDDISVFLAECEGQRNPWAVAGKA